MRNISKDLQERIDLFQVMLDEIVQSKQRIEAEMLALKRNLSAAEILLDHERERVSTLIPVQRRRGGLGELNGNHKLTEPDVIAIREASAKRRSVNYIARTWKLSPGTVSKIVRGVLWPHAGGPVRDRLMAGRPRRNAA